MGVSVARVSQIEHGEVSSFEVIARYIEALGDRLDLVADFGDKTIRLPVTRTTTAGRPASTPGISAYEMPLDSAGQDQPPPRNTDVAASALTCTVASASCHVTAPARESR
jgi:hypothetical protein